MKISPENSGENDFKVHRKFTISDWIHQKRKKYMELWSFKSFMEPREATACSSLSHSHRRNLFSQSQKPFSENFSFSRKLSTCEHLENLNSREN